VEFENNDGEEKGVVTGNPTPGVFGKERTGPTKEKGWEGLQMAKSAQAIENKESRFEGYVE
jgi:hypothetical protein